MAKTTNKSGGSKTTAKKQDNSLHVHQNKKISFDLNIREIPWTDNQKEILENFFKKGSKMTILDGVWGSGKSILAVYACLKLLQEKKISNILYIRNIVQSGSGTLGWLGGDLKVRLEPFMLPLTQKLDELLPPQQVDKLMKDGIVECQPVALLRGTSYNSYGIIIDEMGCMTREDILLTLSRVGKFSHVFAVGDSWQVDLKDSGFKQIFDVFNDEESKDNGIYCEKLREESDIMRSEFLRFVMKKIKQAGGDGSPLI